ncbi:MAG: SDR family NAD(P)-dependent oxidoreductase, partial [Burkholderiales bacterium]|nr:SDR family NAD(P)-dependent oxidoreductase [Burkholderiales bacterium]
MPSTDEPGRVALVTGGAGGIGLAVAGLLQARGWKLALMDLGEPALQAAAARLAGGEVLTVAGDVTRAEDCARAADAAVQRFGGIDLAWA